MFSRHLLSILQLKLQLMVKNSFWAEFYIASSRHVIPLKPGILLTVGVSGYVRRFGIKNITSCRKGLAGSRTRSESTCFCKLPSAEVMDSSILPRNISNSVLEKVSVSS